MPPPSTGQILAFRTPMLIISAARILLSIIVLGLCAYVASQYDISGADYAIFTSLATVIIGGWYIAASLKFHRVYDYWAVLATNIFLIIFWLVSLIVTARDAAIILSYIDEVYDYYDGYYGWDYGNFKTVGACLGAAAGMSALIFLGSIAALLLTIIAINRRRRNVGAPPQHAGAPAPATNNEAEKVQMQPMAGAQPAATQEHVQPQQQQHPIADNMQPAGPAQLQG